MKRRNEGRQQLVVLAVILSVAFAALLSAVAAFAEHGTMPRAHWASGKRFGIPVINRATNPYVLQAAWDWNQAAPEFITLGNYAEGGNPNDCSQVEGAVVICAPALGNPSATVGGAEHLGWCVIRAGDATQAGILHEMGHCLGLGEHNAFGGAMGGEGRVTQVDRDALVGMYSHTDGPPPTTATTAPPTPTTTTTRPVFCPPGRTNLLNLICL